MSLHPLQHVPSRAVKALLAGLALLAPSAAYADLMLYPTRVVISGSQRSGQVQVANRGTGTQTYRISIVNRRMTEAGEINEVEEPQAGEQFADSMLMYTPRQITLQPGETQTIRVSVRKPAELADGEYRSHMQFDQVVAAAGASNLEDAAKQEPGKMNLMVQTLIGTSIPVIVRHGQTSATVSLSDLKIVPAEKEAGPFLSIRFNRQGNQSVYGDVVATYTPAGGESVEVGRVNGLAVYVPNITRTARIPLNLPEGTVLKGGSIKLTYSDRPEDGGKLLAETSVNVP